MNYQFQYPQAFWLLALVPLFLLIFLFYQLWKRRSVKRIGDVALVKSLYRNHSNIKTFFKFFLLSLAFAIGCVVLANPRKPDESSAEARKGIDLVVALDVSNSMLATDINPNRLSRAKQFVSKLIDNLKDDRVGLVVFAGNAYLQMPLTFDQSATRMYVSAANPAAITAQGTSISDALQKANIAFGEQSERFRSVILITDGETHDDNALTLAQELAGRGVMINTVGIGSIEGATIMDTTTHLPKKDAAGQTIVSQLNEPLLQQIAGTTRGTYVHLQSSDEAVKQVLGQYADIEKKALGDTSLYNYETFYMWLAIPMLLFLLIEIFLPDRKKVLA